MGYVVDADEPSFQVLRFIIHSRITKLQKSKFLPTDVQIILRCQAEPLYLLVLAYLVGVSLFDGQAGEVDLVDLGLGGGFGIAVCLVPV